MASYLARNQGKSDRALEAEGQGFLTATALGRRLGVSAAAIRAVLGKGAEWHHTGKFFNKTDYYCIAQITDNGLREAIRRIKAMRAFDHPAPDETYEGEAEVERWSGTKRHPVLKFEKLSGAFVRRGAWWVLPNGEKKAKIYVRSADGHQVVRDARVK